MKEIQVSELRELQMQILDNVDQFCKQKNIRYSLGCGSMLGAVRHGGYIPWDDDLDIYMPREDYIRFNKEYPILMDGKYSLKSMIRDSEWFSVYGKVIDERTIQINKRASTTPMGINIDIFPVDDVPDKEDMWQQYRQRQKNAVMRHMYHVLKYSTSLGIKGNLSLFLHKIPNIGTGRFTTRNNLNRISQENNGKGYIWMFECVRGLFQKHPFPKELFDDLIEWKFEDRTYMGFKDADNYLKNAYGDYMKLPPEEKRVLPHGFKTYWK